MVVELVSKILNLEPTQLQAERLAKGWSNNCYKITSPDKIYFLRLPGKNTDLHVNRQNESHNYNIATKLGLSPKLLYEDSSGIVIREFLDGINTTSFGANELDEVASSMKTLHFSQDNFAGSTNYFDVIRNYKAIIEAKAGTIAADYQNLFTKLDKLEPLILANSSRPVPCHNDLNPNNIIFTDKKAHFIDFECSCVGQAEWDLAYFICNIDISPELEEYFLKSYFGNVTAENRDKLSLYKPLTEVMYAIWSRMQLVLGNFPATTREMEDYEIASINQAFKLFRALEI